MLFTLDIRATHLICQHRHSVLYVEYAWNGSNSTCLNSTARVQDKAAFIAFIGLSFNVREYAVSHYRWQLPDLTVARVWRLCYITYIISPRKFRSPLDVRALVDLVGLQLIVHIVNWTEYSVNDCVNCVLRWQNIQIIVCTQYYCLYFSHRGMSHENNRSYCFLRRAVCVNAVSVCTEWQSLVNCNHMH